MKWITRERPKIDRIACPWLIRKFIDKEAEFIFVPYNEVTDQAARLNAIPFDVPGVEHTHYDDECTFDYFIRRYQLADAALPVIAKIVRGADTDRHELADEAAGLWAISAGLAHNTSNDHQLLETGMIIYDALYSWATHLYKQKHVQNSPFENLLHQVYSRLQKTGRKGGKKTPGWVKELKAMMQDQIDTQFVFDLKKISADLEINPSYLSREFSKYFDDLNFGEYVRKKRIDKAIELINTSTYPLTKIAYLTGFSDQSHFTRVFKLYTGKNPSEYKKEALKR